MSTPVFNIQSTDKEVSGLISFTTMGPKKISHGTLNAPYAVSLSGTPSSASSYEDLRDEMLVNLKNELETVHSVSKELNIVTPAIVTVVIGGDGGGELPEILDNYVVDDVISLSVTLDETSTFVKWKIGDNEISNQQSFDYTITEDCEIICELSPILYSVTINSEHGEIKINGNTISEDEFACGTRITIKSIPESGFDFESWKIGEDVIGTAQSFSYTVTDSAVTIDSTYIELPPVPEPEPPEPVEPFEPLPPPEPATFDYLPTNNVIVEPNITVDDIEIEADADSEANIDDFLTKIGSSIPLIKIGDYVLPSDTIESFKLNFHLNSLPTISLTVNDEKYYIREALKTDIDKCTIFLGYRIWYIKFNAIINNTISEAGDSIIDLPGKLFDSKLYETKQFVYVDTSVKDILIDVCTNASIGLYVVDNPDLNKVIPHVLENTNRLNFISKIIKSYTKNVFMFDCFYYLHVVDITDLKTGELDKYNIDWREQREYEESADLKFSTKHYNEDGDVEGVSEEVETTIPITFYTIDTNYSKIFIESNSIYDVGIGGSEENINQLTNEDFGIGTKSTNTFFGFKDQKFPYYEDIVNTKLGGNLIRLYLDYAIFELTPFSIVDVELFLPASKWEGEKFDEEHSGKKIVIGYALSYEKPIDSSMENKITQTIELI